MASYIDEDDAMNCFAMVTAEAIEEGYELRMLVRDVVTGRLFDSLSDDSIYFSPSEDVLAEEIYQQRMRVDECLYASYSYSIRTKLDSEVQ